MAHDLRWAQHTLDSLTAIVQPEVAELRASKIADSTIAALYPVEPLAYSALLLDLFANPEELRAVLDRFSRTDNYHFPAPFDHPSLLNLSEAIQAVEQRAGKGHRQSAPYALLFLPRSLQMLLMHPHLLDEAESYTESVFDNPLPVFEEVCKIINRLLCAQQTVAA